MHKYHQSFIQTCQMCTFIRTYVSTHPTGRWLSPWVVPPSRWYPLPCPTSRQNFLRESEACPVTRCLQPAVKIIQNQGARIIWSQENETSVCQAVKLHQISPVIKLHDSNSKESQRSQSFSESFGNYPSLLHELVQHGCRFSHDQPVSEITVMPRSSPYIIPSP